MFFKFIKRRDRLIKTEFSFINDYTDITFLVQIFEKLFISSLSAEIRGDSINIFFPVMFRTVSRIWLAGVFVITFPHSWQ
jgi:hypothetical protein